MRDPTPRNLHLDISVIPLLLASFIPLHGASEPTEGIFLQRPDSATGKPVLVPLGRGGSGFGSPEPGVERSARLDGNWVEVVEIRPQQSDTSRKTTTIRNFPARGPALEPVYPAEGICLARRGGDVAARLQKWRPTDRLEVERSATGEWLPIGREPLPMGDYRLDGTGMSAGGQISIWIEGDQLKIKVTHGGSYRTPSGEGGSFYEETIESYPLAALTAGFVGNGFGRLNVRMIRG